jgi:hypothetical protein
MATMTAEQIAYQQRSAATYQARYDAALKLVGMRAPQPVLGQHPDDYRREVLRTVKKTFLQNHDLSRVNMRSLPADVLPQFEAQVLTAAVTEAYRPDSVPPGEFRRVEKLDEPRRRDQLGRQRILRAGHGPPGAPRREHNHAAGPMECADRLLVLEVLADQGRRFSLGVLARSSF